MYMEKEMQTPSAGVGVETEVRTILADARKRGYMVDTSIGFDTLERIIAALQHPAAPSVSPAVEGGLPELPKPWQCETAMCPKLYTADQMRAYGEQCRRLATHNPVRAEQPEGKGAWLPMETAPRNGTLLRLLVKFTEHPTEDADAATPVPTIGANSFDNTGDDEWQFAGWSWEQDCYTQGEGEPVGWLPMLASAPAATGAAVGVDGFEEWLDRDWPLWRNNIGHPIISRLHRCWDAALAGKDGAE